MSHVIQDVHHTLAIICICAFKEVRSSYYAHHSAHVGEVGEEGRFKKISYQDTGNDLLQK